MGSLPISGVKAWCGIRRSFYVSVRRQRRLGKRLQRKLYCFHGRRRQYLTAQEVVLSGWTRKEVHKYFFCKRKSHAHTRATQPYAPIHRRSRHFVHAMALGISTSLYPTTHDLHERFTTQPLLLALSSKCPPAILFLDFWPCFWAYAHGSKEPGNAFCKTPTIACMYYYSSSPSSSSSSSTLHCEMTICLSLSVEVSCRYG